MSPDDSPASAVSIGDLGGGDGGDASDTEMLLVHSGSGSGSAPRVVVARRGHAAFPSSSPSSPSPDACTPDSMRAFASRLHSRAQWRRLLLTLLAFLVGVALGGYIAHTGPGQPHAPTTQRNNEQMQEYKHGDTATTTAVSAVASTLLSRSAAPADAALPPSNRTHVSLLLMCPQAHSHVLRDYCGGMVGCGANVASADAAALSSPAPSWSSYSPHRSSWPSLNLSSWPRDPQSRYVGLANYLWVVQEVDVDLEAGEITVPLVLVRPLAEENPLRTTYLAHTDVQVAWAIIVARRMVTCEIEYGHGQANETTVAGWTTSQHLMCPFRAMRRVRSITVRIAVPPGPLAWPGPEKAPGRYKAPLLFRMGFTGSLSVPLCHVWHRRVLFTAHVRPLFGSAGQLRHLMDWVDYHRRLGVDQFVVPDQSTKMWLRDQEHKEGQSVHAGRLRHAIATGLLLYDVWPHLGNMQQTTLWAATLRLQRSSTWILSCDTDEYLTLPSDAEIFPRTCSNSLWCESPLSLWMRHSGLADRGELQLRTLNVLGATVPLPPRLWLPEDEWRRHGLIPRDDLAKFERVCPFEPETPEAAKRLAAFQRSPRPASEGNWTLSGSRLSSLSPRVLESLVVCDPPYVTRHVYADSPFHLSPANPKSLYRPSYALRTNVHDMLSSRASRVFVNDPPLPLSQMHTLPFFTHFRDLTNGRFELLARNQTMQRMLFDAQPPRVIRRTQVADIMTQLPLPPTRNE